MNFNFINLTSILELCTHDYGATLIETVSIGTKNCKIHGCPYVHVSSDLILTEVFPLLGSDFCF